MSTTPDQPQEPEHRPQPQDEEGSAPYDPLRDLGDKPRRDEAGETAYSAVPPPLPPIADPAQGPVQDETVQNKIGGMGEPPQQAYPPQQDQPGYGQQPYGQSQHGQPQYGAPQYGAPQYGQQQPAYGGAQYGGGPYGGQYQAAPPPPPYQQPYGYPGAGPGLPVGMPPLADWGQRVGAFALDNGPVIVAGWIAGATYSIVIEVVFGIIAFFGLIWAVANAIQAGRTGQSYGKRALGIRLARFADGQPVGSVFGLLRLFLDWLFWVACVIPGVLNFLWPLWDAKHQTWADKIARSVVVRTR